MYLLGNQFNIQAEIFAFLILASFLMAARFSAISLTMITYFLYFHLASKLI